MNYAIKDAALLLRAAKAWFNHGGIRDTQRVARGEMTPNEMRRRGEQMVADVEDAYRYLGDTVIEVLEIEEREGDELERYRKALDTIARLLGDGGCVYEGEFRKPHEIAAHALGWKDGQP